jgi:type I pantothenate kinase
VTAKKPVFAPYRSFTKAEWSVLRADEPMTLTAEDIKRLRSLNDPISLDEAEDVYLPLSRLISFYVEAAQAVHRVSTRFLNTEEEKVPFIIGVAGSVAVGKSTTSRILQALLQRWRTSPKVALVTTDGFLFSNAELEKRGIMDRKGFPESYDVRRLVQFVSDVKSGREHVTAPIYSHLSYDIVPDALQVVDRPDIMIIEGLNVLQHESDPAQGASRVFVSDFFDFSIYVDAEEEDIEQWYVKRFLRLRETAFQKPESFFRNFASLSYEEAVATARQIWHAINGLNLCENILPTRERADLILKKGADHGVQDVLLRKL